MGQQKLLSDAMAAMATAAFITDKGGHIVWANDAFFRATGYSSEEVIGRTPSLLKSGRQMDAFYRTLGGDMQLGHTWQGEVVERKKDGTLYLVEETISPLLNKSGQISHFVSIHHNIAAPRNEQELNSYLAYHDILTGLPNRAFFMDAMDKSIQAAKRSHHYVALLFIDLDHFKPVNDTLGHQAGDRLLRAVAERLRNSVRKSDTVARIGGDEFTVVERGLADKRAALMLARKLVRAVGQPYMINGANIRIGASIGIAIYPDDGEDLQTLLCKADTAMYRVKNNGGQHYGRPR